MLVCQQKIETLDFYEAHPDTDYLVYDLEFQGPLLIKEALNSDDYIVYGGDTTNPTKKRKWLEHWTFGSSSPKVTKIRLWNGVYIYNYTKYDNINELPTLEEMNRVGEIVDTYRSKKTNRILTGCAWMEQEVSPVISKINNNTQIEYVKEYSLELSELMRGGANAVLIYDKVPFETHIDYHQIYAYVMKTKKFPRGIPIIHNGFHKCKFGLYLYCEGTMTLKQGGYALIKDAGTGGKKLGMAGIDGQPTDMATSLHHISSVDLEVLQENFDIEDFDCAITLEFKEELAFNGSQYFGEIVDSIYNNRQQSEGSVKRHYKLWNEYIGGMFERSTRVARWWKTLEPPPKNLKKNKLYYKNPLIGIFITSYARQLLNDLLHKFDKDRVIGYDTDCVFFAGTKEEVEQMPEVMALMGPLPGNVHFDGIYKDTLHTASKHYTGYDLETQEFFKKASGESKTGYARSWDAEKQTYYWIKQEAKNEK